VHIGNISRLMEWVSEVPEVALELMEAFWPGPLTLIFKKAPAVLDVVTGGQDTVGIRMPGHPVALELLKAFDGGVAAPSANRFGHISPTTADAVKEELGDAVDMILEGGQCEVGLESTIVDVSGEHPVILRPGMITGAQIERVLQRPLAIKKSDAPRVSGSLASHYSPETITHLMTHDQIEQFVQHARETGLPAVILARHQTAKWTRAGVTVVAMPDDAMQYAHDLYAVLRRVDHEKFRQIIVERVSDAAEWEAIRDRLERAAV
jgi:L-threonylcarbamoyladenylate synthase